MSQSRFSLFKRSLVITLVLAIAVFIGMSMWQQRAGLTTTGEAIANAKPYFMVFRLLAVVAITAGWSHAMRYLANTKDWTDTQLSTAISLRWRVLGWLVVLELFLGQNLLRQAVALF